MPDSFTLVDAITLTIAVVAVLLGLIGTGLSVFNTYRAIDQDKVKLRVVARWALASMMPDREFLAVSITNLSLFAITLSEVGILFNNDKERGLSDHAKGSDGGPVRRTMEPRTTVHIHFPPDLLADPRFKSARCVYATTDCGVTVESTGPALEQMVAEAQREQS